jgi:hypothetical protein
MRPYALARFAVTLGILGAGAVPAACGSDGDGTDDASSGTGNGSGGDSAGSGGAGASGAAGANGTGASSSSSGAGGCNGDPSCCSDSEPCTGELSCCDGACVDTQSSVDDCGACGVPCAPAHATGTCSAGQCGLDACEGAWLDCNQNPADGCEWDSDVYGPCSCTPGASEACYTGPIGTQDVGPCVGGTHTCDATGTYWGPCVGQVIPVKEVCGDGIDQDCNNLVDLLPDVDGDGWSECDGDCCETAVDCTEPTLVNPGAYDVPGNVLDDDCNGGVDNAVASCDAGIVSSSGNGLDYAKAIELCATTTANPPLPDKRWGVISASLTLADGGGSPASNSRSIRGGFGNAIAPLGGSSLAVLSTGNAAAQAAPNNVSPAYATFQIGQQTGTSSQAPADWVAANGGSFPNSPGCPEPVSGTTAFNPVMLTVQVRVPTNAQSFSVGSYFFSAEYPEWVCSQYNDFFLTLLDSTYAGNPANPADKNLAFYDPPPSGGATYPVGVNLAFGNTGLFQQCENGQTGCALGSVVGNINTCVSTAELSGTGFDVASTGCGANDLLGGGTGWLVTSGNVAPGETMTLRFVVWDTGDQVYDSLVLLDNFTWSLEASQPGTRDPG